MGSMKVVFIASLYKKEVFRFYHLAVIDILETLGFTVFHTHLTHFTIDALLNSYETNRRFHTTLFQTIKDAHIVLADVTHQSFGLGFILAQTLKMQKPVLAISATDTLHPIISFLEEYENFQLHQYHSVRQLEKALPKLLAQLELKKQKKFNVFLPVELDDYLAESADRQKLTKSAYVRKLLEEDRQRPSSQTP